MNNKSPRFITVSDEAIHPKRVWFAALPVNSRNQPGKVGIRAHNSFSALFFRTLTITNHLGKKIYLNRKSVIKYISAYYDNMTFNDNPSDHRQIHQHHYNELVNLSDQSLIDILAHIQYHYPETQHTKKSLNHRGVLGVLPLHQSLLARVRVWFIDIVMQISALGIGMFKFFLMMQNNESSLKKISEEMAQKRAMETIQTTPAYQKHIATTKDVGTKSLPLLADLPPMTKESYIKKHDEKSVCRGGVLPDQAKFDTSSGTTGEPTIWIRNETDYKLVLNNLRIKLDALYPGKEIIFINAFAMGPWATGTTLHDMVAPHYYHFSPGTQKDSIKAYIKKMAKLKNGPKTQYILAGYPPFVEEILGELQQEKNVHFGGKNGIHLGAFVGGQGMSEITRTNIMDKGADIVLSGYGATDLDLNIATEDPLTIRIKRLAEQHPTMLEELFGSSRNKPSFWGRWDPRQYHVSVTPDEGQKKGTLSFTCLRKTRSSPRIRYDLGDVGEVMTIDELVAVAKKYDPSLDITEAKLKFPVMFVWGRESVAIFRGANIAYDELEKAVHQLTDLKKIVRKFSLWEHDGQLDYLFELDPHFQEHISADFSAETFADHLTKTIQESNSEFADALSKVPANQKHSLSPKAVFIAADDIHTPFPKTNTQVKQKPVIRDEACSLQATLLSPEDLYHYQHSTQAKGIH